MLWRVLRGDVKVMITIDVSIDDLDAATAIHCAACMLSVYNWFPSKMMVDIVHGENGFTHVVISNDPALSGGVCYSDGEGVVSSNGEEIVMPKLRPVVE
jgi:hypothetical protein